MVEDVQPGAPEPEDFDVDDADAFNFDFFDRDDEDNNEQYDDDYNEDDYNEDVDEENTDPDLESTQLLEELEEIPDDEKGLGDALAEFLSVE